MSRDPFAHKEGTQVVEILDCTSWQPYRGIPEGSGRSEKQWLVSDDGRIGLFKFPRVDPVSHSVTYEHVSEHLAHRIGTQLDVETATVNIATYQGRIGSLSHLITNENESLLEGLHFILGKHPDFEQETLRFSKTNEYYSIRDILCFDMGGRFLEFWIKMLLFDFMIGNSDRHQSNWAYILSLDPESIASFSKGEGEFSEILRPCPLYDNGSSLCCRVRDDQVQAFLGNDALKLKSLVDTKSRSLVRIDPLSKKRPRHAEVVRYLLGKYPSAKCISEHFLNRLEGDSVRLLIDAYPDNLVQPNRKRLLLKFIQGKTELLEKMMTENNHV